MFQLQETSLLNLLENNSKDHLLYVCFCQNDNKQSTEDLHSFGVPYHTTDRKTEVKPFSFEMRDKQMIERREKKIQEVSH